jgi:hypothetical protein
MIDFRVDGAFEQGWNRLREALEVTQFIDRNLAAAEAEDAAGRLIKHGEDQFLWPRGDLLYPMIVAIFVADFARACRLAEIQRHPYSGGGSRPEGHMATVLSRAVLDERDSFTQAKRELAREWGEYDVYVEFAEYLEAVVTRNQHALDAKLAQADRRYERRAKKEKYLSDYPEVWGGDDYNDMQLDLMSIVACKLARYRGMQARHDSANIPQAVIDFGFGNW